MMGTLSGRDRKDSSGRCARWTPDGQSEARPPAGDDDSGANRTASITHRLRPGRTYYVRMRLVYKGTRGTVTLMYR